MQKVLLVANWDWVLFNFRFALARELKRQGYDVVFVCPEGDYVQRMQEEGFRWVNWPLQRRSLNPLNELKSVGTLAKIYRDENPALIHHDTIKPNFYGSLAVKRNRKKAPDHESPRVINTFMGLGYLFSSHPKASFLRRLLLPILRFALQQKEVFTVFSNQRDLNTFLKLNLLKPADAQVLVSECVDIDRFQPGDGSKKHPENHYRVLMAARLLWDKGVQEFVDASKALQQQNKHVEFWLAGLPDKENPQWVPEEELNAWEAQRLIQWLGHCSDMPDLLQKVDIATLPTHYNEGLPRFLVESAASGLPLIATDIPACRAIVKDGVNGIIIPTQNADALANAISRLIDDNTLRSNMSEASRSIALSEFDEKQVLKEWLSLYKKLIPGVPAH